MITAVRLQNVIVIPLLVGMGGVIAGALTVLIAAETSPVISAAVMAGLVVGGAAVLFPEFALLLVALVVPLERMGRFTDDASANTVSLMRFVGLLALGSFLIHALLKKWKIHFGPAVVLYTAYTIFGIITVFFSDDFLGGARTGGQVIGNLMFLFLIVNVVRNWNLARAAVIVWLAASVLAGSYTVYGWHFGSDRVLGEANIGQTDRRFQSTLADDSEWDNLETVGRAMGTTSHPAVYGINLIFTIPFFFYFLRTQRSLAGTVFIALALLLILYNIFLTNTRANIALGGFILLLCVLRQIVVITPGRLIALLLMGAGMMYFLPQDIYTRVLDIGSYSANTNTGTMQLRLRFWEAAWTGVTKNWLFGAGMGNQLVVPKYVTAVSPSRISAHNEFLNMLVEVGIIGFALFFATVGVIVHASFKAASVLRRMPGRQEQYWFMIAAQLTLLAALLDGLQVDVFHFPLKGWWLVAGLSLAMLRMLEDEQKKVTQ